jgi:uncharacterized protein (TIGR02117 family)
MSAFTRVFFCLILPAAMLASGCSSPQKKAERTQRKGAKRPPAKVWLVSNGWHTSIALRADDATQELRTFAPEAKFLVIGWGGADFYMWRQMNNPMRRVRAMFLPTTSALHVIPVKTSLVKECPNSEVIEFDVTEQGLERLRKRLHLAFVRDPKGTPQIVGKGKKTDSQFFGGTETYFFPKTCNMWAASQLNSAGVPIAVSAAIVADNLCWQGRKTGKVLARRTKIQDPL